MLEAEVQTPFAENDTLVFEANRGEMEPIGLEIPDALLTQQPAGRLFIPVENPACIDLRSFGTSSVYWKCQPPDLQVPDQCPEQTLEVNSVTTQQSSERLDRIFEALALEQGSLSDTEFDQLKQLVRDNADVFALDNSELGHTDLVHHHVDTGDHPPVKQPMRRVPFVYREKIARLMKEMPPLVLGLALLS